jgi:predicted Zn-dependent protease
MAKLIRSDDPWVRLYNGSLLRDVGRLDDAERELRAALQADSDFALPHLFLGLVADSRSDSAAARAAYKRYLARASRTARERQYALDRLEMMSPR